MPVWLKSLDTKYRTAYKGSSKILVHSAMPEETFTRRFQYAIEFWRVSEF